MWILHPWHYILLSSCCSQKSITGDVMYYSDYPMEGNITNFMYRVYGLMAVALSVTAAIAYYVAQSPQFYQVLQTRPSVLFFIVIAQFALVLGLSLAVMRISMM